MELPLGTALLPTLRSLPRLPTLACINIPLSKLICSPPCTVVRKANHFSGKGHRKLCCLADSSLRKPLFLPARNNSFSASLHVHIKSCIVSRLSHCVTGNLLPTFLGDPTKSWKVILFPTHIPVPHSPPPSSPSLQVPGSISTVIKPLLFG